MNIVPSIELIPAKYGVGTLLTQVPMDGSGDFSVTRATAVATRYNSAGLIETIASGIPRLDYYTSSGTPGCPALLVEPSAINLVPNGLGYNAVPGVLYGTTITDSPAIGINSTRITKSVGVGNLRYANQDCSNSVLSGNASYTISRFFKYDGVDFQTTMEANSAAQFGGVGWIQRINIASTGVTLGTSTACTGSIENYGNGWYRASARITTGASPSGSPVQYLMALPSGLLTGEGMLTALPQFEAGSVPTSYVPTTTGSVTRDADVVRKTSITSLLGQSEGAVYFEVEVTSEARDKWICTLDSAANSFIQMAITTNRTILVSSLNAGSTVISSLTSTALSVGYHKVAFAYNTATSGCTMYIDGVQNPVATRTVVAPGLPAFNDMSFGNYITSTTDTLKGRVRAGAIYKTRLPNYLLESATSQIQSYSALASSLSYTVV
jgi:hypothetical protein